MTTVYKYRIYCSTDSNYEYTWAETEPTTCPTNTAHTIDASKTTIVATKEPDTITIKEEITPTQGFYRFQGYQESIPASDPVGNVTSFIISWPFPVSIINGWFISPTNSEGDVVSAIVGENTIVGAITANVTNTDTTFNVSSTVMDNMEVGYDAGLFNGVLADDVGRVLSKDTANSTITVETAPTNNYDAASPTYVRLSVKTVDCLHMNVPGVRYAFAEKKLGGRYVPANIPLTIKYTNNEGNAKAFAFNIEHLY